MTTKIRQKEKAPKLILGRLSVFDDKNGGRLSASYLLIFSLVFLVVSFLCYFSFIIREKSFIWEVDGLSQHYLALMYIGQWFREILRNIFIEHSFSIPVWDFSIGAGGDVITTFNYYGLGDPLCLLSVFVPAKYTVYLYNFLIILRIYLAGIFFSVFCFYKKQRSFETMLGAFTYMFCGYTLFAGTRHPFFLMPMMFFPLFILGAEKILRKESPVLFILAVFGAFLSNFYFSYMLVILTVIYVAVRFFTDKEQKRLLKTIGRFLLFGITGVMMSCLILLPVLIVFLGNDRSGVERSGFRLFNDFFYYASFFSRFMDYANVGTWTITGFTALPLISLVALFRKKGEHLYLKIIFAILTLMLLIPAASKVMNGFAYEANRWVWGYAFFLSYISVVMFRSLLKLNRNDKLTLIAFAGAYLLISIVIAKQFTMSMTVQYAIFALLIMLFICAKELSDKKGRRILNSAVAFLMFLSIVSNGLCCYSTQFSDYIYEFVDTDKAYKLVDKGVSKQMKEEMDEEFCRFEQMKNYVRNAPIVDDTNGVSFYWSLCDNHIGDYLKDSGAVRYTSYNFQHLYKFTVLDALFSVKYFFANNEENTPPFGYNFLKEVKTAEGTYYIYENKHALPLGFTYSDYITREEYMSLSNAERQEALLSNILLEEDVKGFDKNTYTTESYEIPFTVSSTDSAFVEGNKITALKKGATITLEFEDTKDCELYLNFVNLNCDNYLDKKEIMEIKGTWDSSDFSKKLQIIRDNIYSRDSQEIDFKIHCSDYMAKFDHSTPKNQNYDGIHDYLTNLGYSKEVRNSITIEISHPGEFSFDDMKVVANPLETYESKIAQRKANTLENVEIHNNSFEGDITLSKPQLLFVSVPYSEGFTAFVDGEEAEILRANTFGMALALSEGEHHIEFRYHTRGLALGAVLSVAGFAVFTVIAVANRKKKK